MGYLVDTTEEDGMYHHYLDFSEDLDEDLDEAKKRGRPAKKVKRMRGGQIALVYAPTSRRSRRRLISAAQKAAQRKASKAGNTPTARKMAAKSLKKGAALGLYKER